MTSWELLLCGALIFFSAYMSASEIALFSLSRFQLRFLKEHFRSDYRRIKNLLADPGGLLITILVVNEILNVTLSSLIAKSVARSQHIFLYPLTSTIPFISNIPTWALETIIGICITAPLLLLFCEITPKVIAAKINQLIAPLTVRFLNSLYKFFKPIRFVLKKVIQGVSSLAEDQNLGKTSDHENTSILKESDFLLIVEEGRKEGAIQQTEFELIKNVFELDNRTVQEVSTTLNQVLTIPFQSTVDQALATMRNQKFSRIPVSGVNRKEIVGVLYAKDLLRSKLHSESVRARVESLMKKPLFVKSSMRLNVLFRKFKRYKTHMAIVKNEADEVSGVITMNDILDSLFEDLFTDEEINANVHLPLKGKSK